MKKSSWLFTMLLIFSTMITVSANNWISMWIGLELNMMSFVPLMLNKINKSSSEAAMIYFLVQSVSSILMLMMVLINMFKIMNKSYLINSIISMSIMIKLGAAPFHMWLPKIMSNMGWKNCMILMTWQKIAPLLLLSNINNNMIINVSIIWSIMIGGLGGINQTSLRKMMGYSSINHLGWLLAINKSMNLWMIYMMIYSMMIMSICKMFSIYKIYFINQMSNINMNNTEKMGLSIMMLSMGGLPPFIGFLPKWITIQSMINQQEYFLVFIMIMFSLIPLMYYLRIMINMFLSFNISNKWSYNYSYNYSMLMIMIINMSLPLIMIMDIL
uniref:NADH-ubiquinone oxidoreductase chain 2 n=1 Tax=Brachymna tenuis TaxID=2575665 RepID=A0A4D6X2R8_9HEMI|nr:NADH dehydrogenase subunit 2 [Brachymna tenuis]QCI09261.1 NADH dehydrogenase subunit 2 [Brachymna tenuis]